MAIHANSNVAEVMFRQSVIYFINLADHQFVFPLDYYTIRKVWSKMDEKLWEQLSFLKNLALEIWSSALNDSKLNSKNQT